MKEGTDIYSLSLLATWEFMQWGLGLRAVEVTSVQPDLWKSWMQARLGGSHPDADEDSKKDCAGKQSAREAALKEQLEEVVSKQKLVMLPVVYEHHWTLGVITGRGKEVHFEYYDSLQCEDTVH